MKTQHDNAGGITETLTKMGATWDEGCAMAHSGPSGSGKSIQLYWLSTAAAGGILEEVLAGLPKFKGTCPLETNLSK